MAKIDFLRTPEDGNQRIVDGNFKASKALFIPNYSGGTLGLNGNTNEAGAIAFKDGSFYGYNGSTWGSLGGGGISLTSLSATAPVQYNNTTGVTSLSYGNGLTNIGGVLSLGGTASNDMNIFAAGFQFFVRVGTFPVSSDLTFSQTTGFHVTTGTGAISTSSTGVGLGLGSSSLNFTPTGIVLADGLNATGIKYSLDYSANYTARSLIDKGYATSTFAPLLLTGYISGSGTVSSTDTVLQAIQKLNGNIASLTGGVTYKGTWNASTNTPTLTSSVGTTGFLYNVSVSGSTNLNGIATWNIGDQAIYNGSAWEKLPGTAISATAPLFYNTGTGAVSLTFGNGLTNNAGVLGLGSSLSGNTAITGGAFTFTYNGDSGLTVNNTSGSGNIITFKNSTTTVSNVTTDGYYRGAGIYSLSGLMNGFVSLSSTLGTVIGRNTADNVTALKIQQSNVSSTGYILGLQNSNKTVWSIDTGSSINHYVAKTSVSGSATGYLMNGFLKPSANNDVLTGLKINPLFGTSTIATWGSLTVGTGYPNGSYIATLTGGTGIGAVASVTVVSGSLSGTPTIVDSGINYTVGDVLTVVVTDSTGSPVGSGGTVTVATINSYTGITALALQTNGRDIYDQDYSGSYGLRDKVDKGYVDSHTYGIGLGTHDQILSVNTAGTGSEFRTISATGGLNVTFGSGSLSFILKEGLISPGNVDFTVSSAGTLYELGLITANRAITLPVSVGYIGLKLNIWNKNTTGFTWSFVTNIPVTADGVNFTTLTNGTFYSLQFDGTVWVITSSIGSSGTVGTTTNAISFNNSGSGVASGSTFNGSAARTISYNTIGAAPLANPTFTGTVTIPTGAFLNTPASVTLTNATGLPVGAISGLGTGVATFLAAPTSANLVAAVTGETGTGGLVFAISPTFSGTPFAPTASLGTNTTQIATTAFVAAALSGATQYFVTGTFVGSVNPTTPTPGSSSNAFKLGQVVAISNLTATGTPSSTTFLRGDNTWATISGGGTAANPTATIGLSAVNGSATTYMRSDAAPVLSTSISPTMTGAWTFSQTNNLSSGVGIGVGITNTINQTSTAGFTDLLISRTNTAPGSGVQKLLDLQVAGSTVFTVGTTGGLSIPNAGGSFAGSVSTFLFSSSSTYKGIAFLAQNTQVGSSGNPSLNSPMVQFQNNVWNLSGTPATNSVQFGIQSRGISATTPLGQLVIMGYIGSSGTPTFSDLLTLDAATGNLSINGNLSSQLNVIKPSPVAVTVSPMTAAQMLSSVTTSAGAPGFPLTLPTATSIVAALAGSKCTMFMFVIDNVAGVGAVNLTLGTGMSSGVNPGLNVPLGKSQTYLVTVTSSTTCVMSQIN